jgi:hypothetical protein
VGPLWAYCLFQDGLQAESEGRRLSCRCEIRRLIRPGHRVKTHLQWCTELRILGFSGGPWWSVFGRFKNLETGAGSVPCNRGNKRPDRGGLVAGSEAQLYKTSSTGQTLGLSSQHISVAVNLVIHCPVVAYSKYTDIFVIFMFGYFGHSCLHTTFTKLRSKIRLICQIL